MGVIPYGPMSGVIVTGAGSGIGRASALVLAEAGRAVAVWDLNGDAAEAVADEARSRYGAAAASVEIDVRETAAFDQAIAGASRRALSVAVARSVNGMHVV